MDQTQKNILVLNSTTINEKNKRTFVVKKARELRDVTIHGFSTNVDDTKRSIVVGYDNKKLELLVSTLAAL